MHSCRCVAKNNSVLSSMAIKTNLTNLKPARERFKKVVNLVSGGKPNQQYFPDGKLTVFPWDHNIDDWITTRVRSGSNNARTLTFDLLPRLCNLNGCPPNDFLASEVILVMLVSRSVLLNDVIKFGHACPKCGATGEDQVKIPDELSRVGEKAADWPGWDLVTLPESKDVLKIRPATVGEELRLLNRSEVDRKRVSDSIWRMVAVLISVNESADGTGKVDNAQEAVVYLEALAPSDFKYLQEAYDKLQPGISTDVHIKCDGCGTEFEHTLKLDEDFFRRVSDART